MDPKAWLHETIITHPKQRGEKQAAWARRLHGLMVKDRRVSKPWKQKTMPVRLYEALKSERTAKRTKQAPR